MHNNNVLLDFAFVLLVIATFFNYNVPVGTPWSGRFYFNFGWGGLALWVASIIF